MRRRASPWCNSSVSSALESPGIGGARALTAVEFGAETGAFTGTTEVSAGFEADTRSDWDASSLLTIAPASLGVGEVVELCTASLLSGADAGPKNVCC